MMNHSLRSHLMLSILLIACLWILAAPAPPYAQAQTDLFYHNPVHPSTSGMGDPFVFRASDGRYYLYTTSGFDAWSSTDLVNWRSEGKVKTSHRWGQSHFWAPEVVEYEGRFYMYYTARGPLANGEVGGRIVVAVSDSPTGPFEDVFDGPMFDFGYVAIDGHVFIDDDGRKYLFYSKDGSTNIVNGRRESHIYGVELNDDMVTLKGEPVFLSKPEQAWELMSGGFMWNEGPVVVKHDGLYYLMYSANCYCHRHYSVGYSTATSPLGPYTKYSGNPVLSARALSGQGFPHLSSGTGHHSVTRSPDGSEWIIVYHSHADPVVGSGGRQLNIDRLGFRTDGTMYVNGPTVTLQPAPFGSTRLVNVAHEARLSASSVKEGFSLSALTDGEIGIDVLKASYDWVSDGERAGAWVDLAWEQPQRIEYVLIYPSATLTRKLTGGVLRYSDGSELNVDFPEEPGAAAIVPAPRDEIEWVRFIASDPKSANGEVGLSEIMVLGHRPGTAWISVPQSYGQVTPDDGIRIEALDLDVTHVRFAVNGAVVYEGATLPDGPVLRTGDLGEGVHRLKLEVEDRAGNLHTEEVEFGVVYAKWVLPESGARLQGDAVLRPEIVIPQENVAQVTLALAPIVGGERVGWNVLYSGPELPETFAIDTLTFPDGAYDVVIEVETVLGRKGEQARRVVFENWDELEEAFLPPVDAGWFGKQERLRTSARSTGWTYHTDEPEAFWGDVSRIAATGSDTEWLVWQHPRLTAFRFTVYARDAEVEGVTIEVSSNGTQWIPVDYQVQVLDESPLGWSQMALVGEMPQGVTAHQLRLTVVPTDGAATDLQLGHLVLMSPQRN